RPARAASGGKLQPGTTTIEHDTLLLNQNHSRYSEDMLASHHNNKPSRNNRSSTNIDSENRANSKPETEVLLICHVHRSSNLGLSYAAVPLYRVFCSVTGYNGTPLTSKDGTGKFAPDRIDKPIGLKNITVRFNADKSDTLNWKFWPCQKSVIVKPGETVLAFFKAKNLSDHDILGSTLFRKSRMFCFDEQKLLAGEEVDLPIFFFIDKDFVEDPLMKDIDDIVLSYTFFETKFIWLFRTRYPYDPNNNNQKLVDLNPPPNHHQQRLSRTDNPTTTTTDSTSHTITK
ncbi:hypothetical protein PSHT_04756, partial [Puccinia striiformis]